MANWLEEGSILELYRGWVSQPLPIRFIGFCAVFACFVLLEWAVRGRRALRFGQYGFLVLCGLVGASGMQLLAGWGGSASGVLGWHPELAMIGGFLLGAGYGGILLRANQRRPQTVRLGMFRLLFRIRFAVVGGVVGALCATLSWGRLGGVFQRLVDGLLHCDADRVAWVQCAVFVGSAIGLGLTAWQLQRSARVAPA